MCSDCATNQLFALLSQPRKGSCAHSAEGQTLTAGVCSKVRVYLQGAKHGEWAAHAQKTRTPPMALSKGF